MKFESNFFIFLTYFQCCRDFSSVKITPEEFFLWKCGKKKKKRISPLNAPPYIECAK